LHEERSQTLLYVALKTPLNLSCCNQINA